MFLLRQAVWFAVSPTWSSRHEGYSSSLSTSCTLAAARSLNPRPPPPPDITPLDDDGDEDSVAKYAAVVQPKRSPKPKVTRPSRPIRQSHTVVDRPRSRPSAPQTAASWMDRNAHFAAASSTTSFRDDFRGTRVFLQGIPPGTSWQTLKDHCRTVLDKPVVYASISHSNPSHGIVQFETTDAAQYAIQALRNFPIDGSALYARADVKQQTAEGQQQQTMASSNTNNRSSPWHCANSEEAPSTAKDHHQQQQQRIYTILHTRDAARRRHNFPAADAMREQLRREHGVQLDDRLQLWWWSDAPDRTALPEWRHIPTEHDAAAPDPAVIRSLLEQRDAARRRKDFALADDLLEQVVTAPEPDGWTIRVHDESRTWRLWVERSSLSSRRPSTTRRTTSNEENETDEDAEAAARRDCLELVHTNNPSHLRDVLRLLEQFPASSILPKLRQRYSSSKSSP